MCALNLLFTFSSFLKSSSNSCTFTLEFLFAILPTWSCSEVSKATNLFAFIFSKKLDFENRLDNEVVQFCERSQTCNAASQVWMKIVLRVISHEKNMICGSWLVVRFSSHVKNTTLVWLSGTCTSLWMKIYFIPFWLVNLSIYIVVISVASTVLLHGDFHHWKNKTICSHVKETINFHFYLRSPVSCWSLALFSALNECQRVLFLKGELSRLPVSKVFI